MNWLPALDLAAEYWRGITSLPPDFGVIFRLRRAIDELRAQEIAQVADAIPVPDIEPQKSESRAGKQSWNVEEDRELKKLAQELSCDWEEIAARMPGRTAYMCRKRWEKRLRAKTNTKEWLPEEDEVILAMYAQLGEGKWRDIAVHLSNRTPEAVQNRFHFLQKKDVQGGVLNTSAASVVSEEAPSRESKMQHLRENADRLEARIIFYKEELRKLEDRLDFSES